MMRARAHARAVRARCSACARAAGATRGSRRSRVRGRRALHLSPRAHARRGRCGRRSALRAASDRREAAQSRRRAWRSASTARRRARLRSAARQPRRLPGIGRRAPSHVLARVAALPRRDRGALGTRHGSDDTALAEAFAIDAVRVAGETRARWRARLAPGAAAALRGEAVLEVLRPAFRDLVAAGLFPAGRSGRRPPRRALRVRWPPVRTLGDRDGDAAAAIVFAVAARSRSWFRQRSLYADASETARTALRRLRVPRQEVVAGERPALRRSPDAQHSGSSISSSCESRRAGSSSSSRGSTSSRGLRVRSGTADRGGRGRHAPSRVEGRHSYDLRVGASQTRLDGQRMDRVARSRVASRRRAASASTRLRPAPHYEHLLGEAVATAGAGRAPPATATPAGGS